MSKTKRAVPHDFITEARSPLPGSEKSAITSATQAAPRKAASPRKQMSVSVIVSSIKPVATAAIAGKHLSRAKFKAAHGSNPDSVDAVSAFAKAYNLKPKSEKARSTVTLTGSVADMQKAFSVTLHEHTIDGTAYRVREGGIHIPNSLLPHVHAVLGLDNRPQAQPHFRVAKGIAKAHTVSASFNPPQLATLYGFPSGAKATGQTIALIELGGGYRTTDITAYFKSIGVTKPTVTAVLVDGGKNAPSTADGADGEVMLDIEVAAGVAPGAKIAVYFAPNTDQGFVDAITTAAHDTKNKPTVISISWGGPENSWTQQSITAMDNACKAAAALGITVTVAAGDNGSDDGVGDKANHVDFPGSSPNVLCCGGTKLVASSTAISSEVVWNETANNEGATGGGISTAFPQPTWQSSIAATKSGRGVPDVAGDADPTTGYNIRVDGKTMVIGGTSAVAPLWAGLIALSNALNKNAAGLVQPKLYTVTGQKAFRDITSGNNGAFEAGPGWDACTGLGSPIGTSIVSLLATKKASKASKEKAAKASKAAKGKKAKAA
jgi:kumamolisin